MNTGGGSGGSGNVIVSVTGEVLGYDPIDFGTGYSKNTTVYIDDDCGTGSGAIIEPVIEDYTYTDDEGNEVKTQGVVDIIVLDPGQITHQHQMETKVDLEVCGSIQMKLLSLILIKHLTHPFLLVMKLR